MAALLRKVFPTTHCTNQAEASPYLSPDCTEMVFLL